uniref:DNA replication helicase/nuclease 2 n=1 Tax=Poecilia latipinna TaxID=48699 RepID=A0A3B3UUV2_9TELE
MKRELVLSLWLSFSGVSFRLDSDEGVVGLSTHLSNLSRLMESSGDSERLRELVVDLRPPEFITNLSSVLPREAKDTVANILKGAQHLKSALSCS